MRSLLSVLIVQYNQGFNETTELGPDSSELISRLIAGDKNAFAEIYHKYNEVIYRFAIKYVKNTEIANDVTQDTFVRLLKAKEQIIGKKGVRSYLFTIALNMCYDYLKKASTQRDTSLDKLHEDVGFQIEGRNASPEQNAILGEMESVLAKVIEALPEKERDIIMLRKLSGMKYDEIAEVVGFSTRYIKKIVHKALVTIEERFSEAGFIEDGRLIL